eukprot:GHVT01055491.1.p1 GENE.GHVT01055491.1~~GHVT01055491.1.p1  ORF type:complete len:160 (+),score=17.28 GHVT01055491.1:418-897(+)
MLARAAWCPPSLPPTPCPAIFRGFLEFARLKKTTQEKGAKVNVWDEFPVWQSGTNVDGMAGRIHSADGIDIHILNHDGNPRLLPSQRRAAGRGAAMGLFFSFFLSFSFRASSVDYIAMVVIIGFLLYPFHKERPRSILKLALPVPPHRLERNRQGKLQN